MKKLFYLITLIAILSINCSYESPIVEWGDGNIPYYLSGDFSEQDIINLNTAMQKWMNVCGVRFKHVTPRSSAYEIIRLHKSSVWTSTIGENNVHNYMYFCDYDQVSHATHELGHCIGLIHEHQRPDRDNYVRIVWNKILPEYRFNFEIKDNPLIIEENYLYDFNSIMHYQSKGFSTDGSDTITLLDGSPLPKPGVIDLSDSDKSKAHDIYGDPKAANE